MHLLFPVDRLRGLKQKAAHLIRVVQTLRAFIGLWAPTIGMLLDILNGLQAPVPCLMPLNRPLGGHLVAGLRERVACFGIIVVSGS